MPQKRSGHCHFLSALTCLNSLWSKITLNKTIIENFKSNDLVYQKNGFVFSFGQKLLPVKHRFNTLDG